MLPSKQKLNCPMTTLIKDSLHFLPKMRCVLHKNFRVSYATSVSDILQLYLLVSGVYYNNTAFII